MRMSVVIPCYEMKGIGNALLDHSLKILSEQTFKDFEVIITDHSINDAVKLVCDKWNKIINIKYIRNEEKKGSPSANTNCGIKNSEGEIIKILCQDDYLYNELSLEKTSNEFTDDINWLVSSYYHTQNREMVYRYHIPKMNPRIYLLNTIGTPSCLTIRNKDIILIDEQLSWFYDCEYYKRLYDKFGMPKIHNEPIMVNYIWGGQMTNTVINNQLRYKETKYLVDKYERKV